MKDSKKNASWIIKLVCPFCKSVIVQAVDHSMLPKDMSDDEREAITCGEDGNDAVNDYCEHVAFFSDWAYVGHNVPKEWEKEMCVAAKALNELRDPPYDDPDADPGGVIDDARVAEKRKNLEEIIKKALPGYDCALRQEYVEKYDGVSCGGPSYGIIFLKKRSPERKKLKIIHKK